jgi:hypothetical protein
MVALINASGYVDVSVANPEFVAPSGHETIIVWIDSLELNYVESNLLMPKVAKQIKFLVLEVIEGSFNDSDSIELIHVNFLFFPQVDPETIIFVGDECQILSMVHVEKVWLITQLMLEFIDYIHLFSVEVI